MNQFWESFAPLLALPAGALGIVLLVGAIPVGIGIGHFIIGPLKSVDVLRGKVNFRVSDMFSLMVLLQIALAIVARFAEGEFTPDAIGALILLTGALALVWYGAIKALATTGVDTFWKRNLAILLVLPGAVMAMMAAMGWLFTLAICCFALALGEVDSLDLGIAAAFVAIGIGTALASGLLRLLAAWVGRNSKSSAEGSVG